MAHGKKPLFESNGTFSSYHEIKKQLLADLNGSKEYAKAYLLKKIGPEFFKKKELAQVAKDLIVALKGEQIVVLQSPDLFPWNSFSRGELLGELKELSAEENQKANDFERGLKQIQTFEYLSFPPTEWNQGYLKLLDQLQEEKASSSKISAELENSYPLLQRLKNAGNLFQVLPGRNGEWLPLKALIIKTYDPHSRSLKPVDNFTAYPEKIFREIQSSYIQKDLDKLGKALTEGYSLFTSTLENSIYPYPSKNQLVLENIYYEYPWILLLVGFYLGSFFSLLFLRRSLALAILLLTFFLHTSILAARCWILSRPPVSNMSETILYVPWTAVLFSLILCRYNSLKFLPAAAAIISALLLCLGQWAQIDWNLNTVQPVLNSQYWLAVHVMMVVASYGAFLLAGTLAHIFFFVKEKQELFTQWILQLLYMGTALLICGTLLGGVWAAQSWGRFWDWDPKESWAFISSSIYLMIIHLYRFRLIADLGLAVGGIIGMQAVIFTWYGVNYILGTGLHSYGFGNGGYGFYYLFAAAEFSFILYILLSEKKKGALMAP